MKNHPTIIQGGMGAGVSSWRLARAVGRAGQLGVVSGTALDQILVRRLQDGDPSGQVRHGLDHFPFPETAERIWRTYYIAGGKARINREKCIACFCCQEFCESGAVGVRQSGLGAFVSAAINPQRKTRQRPPH